MTSRERIHMNRHRITQNRSQCRAPPSISETMRFRLSAGAVLLLAAALGGCGGSEDAKPAPKAIAIVGGTRISQLRFDRTVRSAEAEYAAERGYPGKKYYVPPDFRLCVRDRRGGRSAKEVLAECKGQYAGLRGGTLISLIENLWIEQGARERGIHVSLAKLRKDLAVPNAASEAPVHRIDLLSEKIIRAGTKGKNFRPSEAQVQAYYIKNRQYFAEPESRDVIGFAAASRMRATQAARELRQGEAWSTVAKRYAIAEEPDRFPAVPRAYMDPTMGERAFSTREGIVSGPFRTGGHTWYVMTVKQIHPPFHMSLEQARKTISDYLAMDIRRDARLKGWIRFREHSRANTKCLTAVRVPVCANGSRAGFVPGGVLHDPVPPVPTLPLPNKVIGLDR